MGYRLGKQNIMIYPEGATPLDPEEMEGLKFKHVTTREQLDHLEQANIESGLIWLKRQKSPEILTEFFIKELHKKLFGDVWKWAGNFRKTQKNIGIESHKIATELRNLLDDVQYWINNNTYSPIEIILRFHHKLVYIHLFPNGNGRHARIMADALAVHQFELQEIDWARGHKLTNISERRSEYIEALRKADKNNYRSLLEFVGVNHD